MFDNCSKNFFILGYNHVTFNKKLSDSIQIISNKTCQNERSIRESQISLFPLETDAGMRLLFGLGYHGIVRGQVLLHYNIYTSLLFNLITTYLLDIRLFHGTTFC